MKGLSIKDGVAALVIAAILVPYAGYVIRGHMPFIQDARGMAGVGIVGLLLAYAAWGLRARTGSGRTMIASGVAALALGLAAAFVGGGGNDAFPYSVVVAILPVWTAETLFDVGGSPLKRRPKAAP